MQGEDALRTVECLRGRLHAERVASKAAKDTAELFNKKLKELEEKLKIESKCRRNAEKKLNILKKKLESFNITFSIPQEYDQYSSSDPSEISFISSTGSADDNLEQTVKAKSDTDGKQQLKDIENCHGLNELALKENNEKKENQYEEKEVGHCVDSSMGLALVPVGLPTDSNDTSNAETKANSESVRQVLNILKQIRENILSTMERRHFI